MICVKCTDFCDLCADLRIRLATLRKSVCKFARKSAPKAVNFTHIQLNCDQLVSTCVGWSNGEKLASTCVRIRARPKASQVGGQTKRKTNASSKSCVALRVRFVRPISTSLLLVPVSPLPSFCRSESEAEPGLFWVVFPRFSNTTAKFLEISTKKY